MQEFLSCTTEVRGHAALSNRSVGTHIYSFFTLKEMSTSETLGNTLIRAAHEGFIRDQLRAYDAAQSPLMAMIYSQA